MRVLAIDTALEACSAAVLDTEHVAMSVHESLPKLRGHAEALMPMIARVMDRAGLDFAALDRIAVTTGPGSFTGLRVGLAAARGIALATGKPAIGLSTLAAYAAPLVAADGTVPVVAAIDARHDHVYVQVFGPGGRTIVPARLASIREALRAAAIGAPRLVGTAAAMLAAAWPIGERAPSLVDTRRAPDIDWVARLGAAAIETGAPPKPLYLRAPDAQPQNRRAIGATMMGLFSNLFARNEPVLSEASSRDAAAIAALHAASFARGWSEQEVEGLLTDRHVIAYRAMVGSVMAGFIMSRLVEDEAEILSIAVAGSRRGRGLARNLLTLHLRRLAGLGARAVFLEVDEHNVAAIRLYGRAGFREISRRPNYYPGADGKAAAALVLRRDLV